jgi:hypothetical protein
MIKVMRFEPMLLIQQTVTRTEYDTRRSILLNSAGTILSDGTNDFVCLLCGSLWACVGNLIPMLCKQPSFSCK